MKKQLIELYKKRNEAPKEEQVKYNQMIEKLIPTTIKKCGFVDAVTKEPIQFEIIGIANNVRWIGDFPCLTIINGEKVYNRILIKRLSAN